MIRRTLRFLTAVALLGSLGAAAQAPERLVLATNWYAQAEHGGFYQAVAEGLYRRQGLDVQIRMGGPQVNPLQLLVANQIDVAMGDDLQTIGAIEQGLPVTTIAATFQKNPTVIVAHPGVRALADLKGKPIAIGAASNTTFWPWLKQKYGFTDDQKRPYAFSVQPFLADPQLSQQGYVTSEPFSIEKGGVMPVVFLLADLGYPPYAQSLVVTQASAGRRADALRRFLVASAEGWKSYLANPAPGNALIRRDNPEMSDELLAYGHRKLREYALVTGGDAPTAGLLTMTDARWKQTIDFLKSVGLAKPSVDYAKAYTLAIVRDVKVLP
jgi:NitT/TauT family transport system substrate-binding protein